jgi:hypothetical protein
MTSVKILKVKIPHKVIKGVPFKVSFLLKYRSCKKFELFLYIIEEQSKVLVSYRKHIHKGKWNGKIHDSVMLKVNSGSSIERLLFLVGWIDHHKKVRFEHDEHNCKHKTK